MPIRRVRLPSGCVLAGRSSMHRSYARVQLTATKWGRHDERSSLHLRRCSGFLSRFPQQGSIPGCVCIFVLRALVRLVSARGLLYRSKPSIEVTNVNADTPECKAGYPPASALARRPTEHPTAVGIQVKLPPTSVSKSPGEAAPNSALARRKTADFLDDRRNAASAPYRRRNAELRPPPSRRSDLRRRPANWQLR